MNVSTSSRSALCATIAAALLAACGGSQPPIGAPGAMAQTASTEDTPQRSLVRHAYRVLHSFGGSGDGMNTSAGLVDVKGTLYGTTVYGGANNAWNGFRNHQDRHGNGAP